MSQKSVFRRAEQAECEAKIRDEWLLRPREGLTTEESKEVQTEIDNIVAADQPAEKITTCRGAVTLFFCASPNESQRQELRKLAKVSSLTDVIASGCQQADCAGQEVAIADTFSSHAMTANRASCAKSELKSDFPD